MGRLRERLRPGCSGLAAGSVPKAGAEAGDADHIDFHITAPLRAPHALAEMFPELHRQPQIENVK